MERATEIVEVWCPVIKASVTLDLQSLVEQPTEPFFRHADPDGQGRPHYKSGWLIQGVRFIDPHFHSRGLPVYIERRAKFTSGLFHD